MAKAQTGSVIFERLIFTSEWPPYKKKNRIDFQRLFKQTRKVITTVGSTSFMFALRSYIPTYIMLTLLFTSSFSILSKDPALGVTEWRVRVILTYTCQGPSVAAKKNIPATYIHT